VGLDDDSKNMSLIDFKRIKGGKPFDVNQEWFKALLAEIGQIN
jgi:pyrophosphate--fructose-6-phosphate 1-phosphotransferase